MTTDEALETLRKALVKLSAIVPLTVPHPDRVLTEDAFAALDTLVSRLKEVEVRADMAENLVAHAEVTLNRLRAQLERQEAVVDAAREYVEQQEIRREIGREGRASLGDTSERPVPPDYERLVAALSTDQEEAT